MMSRFRYLCSGRRLNKTGTIIELLNIANYLDDILRKYIIRDNSTN